MRITFPLVLIGILLAAALQGAPVITSVTPSSGPVGGGTEVTIRGTGFSEIVGSPSLPPAVYFGTSPASVKWMDETTIVVVSPARPAGTVAVSVFQTGGSHSLPDAFTFIGEPESGFVRILAPIFTPPVRGAFGSEFHTVLRVSNASRDELIYFYGLDTTCLLISPPLGPMEPRVVANNGETRELSSVCSEWPARFFLVPKPMASRLVMNLRVRDVSRSDLSHGTEIPLVSTLEFRDRVVLLGVPIDNRFRNTLRIYGLPGRTNEVRVTIGNQVRELRLQPGRDEWEPPYAVVSDFPMAVEPGDPSMLRVVVDSTVLAGGIAIPLPSPIWAFISVTNNTTQEITTITP